MLRSLVVTPFALALGLLLAKGDAIASAGQASTCPAECDACTDGTCRIACAPGSSCARQIVSCPSGMDCEVTCTGDAACASATIVGPIGRALEVECSGVSSCSEIVLNASRDLELSCEGDAACSSATLYCGSGTCDWACATAGSCEGVAIE